MVVLDGSRLARNRQGVLTARAQEILQHRGRSPALLLLAFGDDGHAAHVNRKLAAAAAIGIRVVPLILPTSTSTESAVEALSRTIEQTSPDAVFLQVPFPDHISEPALAEAIPRTLDIDVMNPDVVHGYFENPGALPPVTVTAALLLFDAYDIAIEGRQGIVIAHPSPFAEMFRTSLVRRGAHMAPLLVPDTADLKQRAARANLVIVATGQPGAISVADLAPGSVAVDVGYFNPGGKGDINTDSSTAHLGALAPVPGGIGPMTISALLERTVDFAARSLIPD